jgi:AP-3 complex subunit beta
MTARDLTLEAAKDVGPRRPSRPLPAQQIKKLLDSRNEREVLDGLRRIIAVRDSGTYNPWKSYAEGTSRCNMQTLRNPP